MKLKPEMDPAAAFPDATHQPDDAELHAALGPAATALEKVFAPFRTAQPTLATAWQFSPRSGWYRLHLIKKRRLLYLVPQRDDFRLMIILGGKAVELLKQGPFAKPVAKLLKTAKRYPEGTVFSFNRRTLNPDLLAAFLAAKIAH